MNPQGSSETPCQTCPRKQMPRGRLPWQRPRRLRTARTPTSRRCVLLEAQSAGLETGSGTAPPGTLPPSRPAPVAMRRWVRCGWGAATTAKTKDDADASVDASTSRCCMQGCCLFTCPAAFVEKFQFGPHCGLLAPSLLGKNLQRIPMPVNLQAQRLCS